MAKNYEVDNKNKVIYAKVESLTEKQIKTIRNYIALGYSLQEKKKETANGKFKKEAVIAYIEANGTEEQKARFYGIMEEPARDKDSGEIILTKEGTQKKKGYIASLKYFQSQFPNY